MTITFSEVTNKADFAVSRDLPFITVIAIFAQITMALIQMGQEIIKATLTGGATDGSAKT